MFICVDAAEVLKVLSHVLNSRLSLYEQINIKWVTYIKNGLDFFIAASRGKFILISSVLTFSIHTYNFYKQKPRNFSFMILEII